MPHGRIAVERFRDVDLVPLESVLQTCAFCNSSRNGSTDTDNMAPCVQPS